MDPSAPQTVLKGVAITSSLCGVAAGLYGGFKHGAATKFLVYSAVNSGIVAATFFSIREYVVSPILVLTLPERQYQMRRQNLAHPESNPTLEEAPLSWSDIRTYRLLDTGVSGGLAGGLLNAWKRGRHGLVPGLTTGALMCTLLQWCFNEFNILRIRSAFAHSDTSAQHAPHISDGTGHQGQPEERPEPVAMQRTSPASTSSMERIFSIFGQRISDEKYLEKLKTERDSYLRRIAELEEKKTR